MVLEQISRLQVAITLVYISPFRASLIFAAHPTLCTHTRDMRGSTYSGAQKKKRGAARKLWPTEARAEQQNREIKKKKKEKKCERKVVGYFH